MPRSLIIVFLLAVAALIGVSQAQPSGAAFHIMRVYGVMGGANGDSNVQYVELRMAAAFQNVVSGHHLCFYDATGSPYARFAFTSNVSNTVNGSSILIGTSEFDAVWAAGSPDFVLSGANTVAIAGGADVAHPVRSPGGKVSFGTDFTATPALMCQVSFAIVDSVAYGTGYSGTVDFGTNLNADLPTADTDAARLQGPVCFPPSCTRNNSTDYAITDVNVPLDNPRNNAGAAGPVTMLDTDGDGFPDSTDNCPTWPNPAQIPPPWTVPPGDDDCDGLSTTIENYIGTDPNDPCADTPDAGDEADDKWPIDFTDDQFINSFDLIPYIGILNTVGTVRVDLSMNGFINTFDLIPFVGNLNKACFT